MGGSGVNGGNSDTIVLRKKKKRSNHGGRFSYVSLSHCAKKVKFSNLWFRGHCDLSLTAGRSLHLDVSFKIVRSQPCMVCLTHNATHGKRDGKTATAHLNANH